MVVVRSKKGGMTFKSKTSYQEKSPNLQYLSDVFSPRLGQHLNRFVVLHYGIDGNMETDTVNKKK